MCGIVGFITLKDDTRRHSKEKFFREALFVDTLRGADSTGLMQLSDDFQWSYHKMAMPGPDYLQEKSIRERKFDTWCSIGHNRAATLGAVTTANAHPFHHGDVTLVHNGTLRTMYDLPHDNRKLKVDSELIAYNLSKEAPEDAHKVLNKLNGAFALVWFDERDSSVNLVRNGDRPLHIGMTRSCDALYIASDGHMLNFVTSRLSDSTSRPAGIWQITPYQHLKYKKGSLVPEVASISPFTYKVHRQDGWYTPKKDTGTTGTTGTTTNSGVDGYSDEGDGYVPARCMIAGNLVEIPKAHEKMLQDWYQTRPSDEIYFIPKAFMPWGTSGIGEVHGKMWHKEWETYFDAKVTGISQGSARAYMCPTKAGADPAWTVTAIGCDHTSMSGGIHELTFILRPKWFSYRGAVPVEEAKPLSYAYEEAIQAQVDQYERDTSNEETYAWEDGDEVDQLFPGPHGQITEESFQILTGNGCCMCGGNIDIMEADEIVWVGEMNNQPLCGTCLEEETQGGTYDAKN